ncbi:Prostaglandin F synthase [Tetrabaena socialis]|uniref:Prostaglandin F synthase n=1 Tax=Tetrabaena socialis TaxID=47790 RepID=A0A2J8AHE0_9CHLO|nr:Prostaglandin F synthase [Tetrabaena socialis]|eukprot:PNH11932.1 Prostaglandin F synthase [Tetrabaena socialis]
MPTVGLGVYKSVPGDETYTAVLSALGLGYRHIDTAQVYGNEADVGRAVRDSGIPRGQVFVTSKVWRDNYGYDSGLASIQSSVERVGLGYLDLMLLHAPGDPARREGAWRALEEAVKQASNRARNLFWVAPGLVRSIGVSNFSQAHLEKLQRMAVVQPAIEVTPFLQRKELVSFCQGAGIVVQAYSPLSKGAKLADPTVVGVAQRLGVTPAQVMIRWSLQHGLVPLPKSTNPGRQATNLDVHSFELDSEAMAELDALEEGLVTGWDPIKNDPV